MNRQANMRDGFPQVVLLRMILDIKNLLY